MRKLCLAALLALTACGSHAAVRIADVQTPAPSTTTASSSSTTATSSPTTTTTSPPATTTTTTAPAPRIDPVLFARWLHGLQIAATDAGWEAATVSTRACIRGAESGWYGDPRHPRDGTGAYQIIPSTWASWSARWARAVGYVGPMPTLAYQAEPWMQDGVVAYMLLFGGAANWSNNYGRDGCTGH